MRIAKPIKRTRQAFSDQLRYTSVNSVSKQEQKTKQLVKFLLASAAATLVLLEPSIVLAADDTTNQLSVAAVTIKDMITGTLGKAVATIAIVIMGLMAMFGKLEWDRAFKVILGIAIVFGATTIINLFGGAKTITGL